MNRDKIAIACVQANPTVGDIAGNLAIVRRMRAQFRGKADLLVFSECFASGYPLGDLALRPGFIPDVRVAVETFAQEMAGDDGPAVLIGAPREGAGRPYNAAFLIETDGTMQVTDKAKLPNEEVYDEKRVFAEGAIPKPLSFRGYTLGVAICEDFWHGDITRALVEEGAEALIVINGSHFRIGKLARRHMIASDTVRRLGVPLLFVNQIGGQDELVFDGGSFAMSRSRAIRAQLGFIEDAFLVDLAGDASGADIGLSFDEVIRNGAASAYPTDDLATLYMAMTLALKDYVRKSGFAKGVVIGMSGGLDSALTAAIAVDALGADKVLLVRMPSSFTGSASMDDAAEAARLLGTRMETIAIGPAVEAYRAMLSPLFTAEGREAVDTTEENIQARARGMTLMAISNKLGHMLLTTGNKSEMSVGYATLYGDMCGGFSVLKDCYKTTAFALARWRNANRPAGALGPEGAVMPQAIIDKPPSAELAEGQTDEASLGAYEHLDAVLKRLVEGQNPPDRAAALATRDLRHAAREAAMALPERADRAAALAAAETIDIPAEYAYRIARLVRGAQYKRRQSPPGVVLTERDYGQGWRFPIAGAYQL